MTLFKYYQPARALAFATALLGSAAFGRAQPPANDVDQLREQIRQLDQKLRVLERKQELKDEESAAAAKTVTKVTAGDKGFSLASADGAHALKLRGLIQADSRWFFGDHVANNDAFLLRRARLIFEGVFNKIYEFQLVPEFGGTSGNGTLTLLDANINVALRPEFQIRAGRFREPVGLEQLQSDAVAFFAERSVVSQFVPNRDVGVQIAGELFDGKLSYAVGAFNGVGDGSSNANNSDTNDEKDFAARLFATPFKSRTDALAGLGFGIAGSVGRQNSENGASSAFASGYRTDGQQTWFTYRGAPAGKTAPTTVVQGATWRISPQAYYYSGPLGAQAEYVISAVEAAYGGNAQNLQHEAWQLSAGYVLTGEDAGYKGVVPRASFAPDGGTWGAFEIVGRIAGADIDDDAFLGGSSSLANPNVSATAIASYAVGLNWYLSKTVRASFDFFHSDYELAPGAIPAVNAVIHDDENAFVTRLQVNF